VKGSPEQHGMIHAKVHDQKKPGLMHVKLIQSFIHPFIHPFIHSFILSIHSFMLPKE